jgi:hypothetical protein
MSDEGIFTVRLSVPSGPIAFIEALLRLQIPPRESTTDKKVPCEEDP